MKLSTAPLPFVKSTPSAWPRDDTKRTLVASMTVIERRACAKGLESDPATRNELHEKHDERDDQKNVDEPADVEHEPAKRPQNQQDQDDRPEHLLTTSFRWSTGRRHASVVPLPSARLHVRYRTKDAPLGASFCCGEG